MRVGRVSYYPHHGAWHVYYRDGDRQVRRTVADDRGGCRPGRRPGQRPAATPRRRPCWPSRPITVPELRRRFLDYHEHVLRSSLATVGRYRAATQHLEDFAAAAGPGRPWPTS